jgi:hypothetical protein
VQVRREGGRGADEKGVFVRSGRRKRGKRARAGGAEGARWVERSCARGGAGGVCEEPSKTNTAVPPWTRVGVVVVRHAARGWDVWDGMSAFDGIIEGALGGEGHYIAVCRMIRVWRRGEAGGGYLGGGGVIWG